jgi:hypothetical protein
MANIFAVHIEPKEIYFNAINNYDGEAALGNLDEQVSYNGVSGASRVIESSDQPEQYHDLINTLDSFNAFYFQAEDYVLLSTWVNGLKVSEFATKFFFTLNNALNNVVYKVRNTNGFPVKIFYNYYGFKAEQ